MLTHNTFELRMGDGNVNALNEWLPENFNAVVVVSHGMQEHSLRYARFADFLGANGLALLAGDHRGHGRTALRTGGAGALSFLAEEDGFNRVTEDLHEVSLYARQRFKGKRLFLFGHSFGSFVALNLLETRGSLVDKAVLCGSAGPRRVLLQLAKAAGLLAKKFCGARTKSKLMNALTFGSYTSKIPGAKTAFDWLSRDAGEVAKYLQDPLCGVAASNGFLCDLFGGLSQIHKKANLAKIPKELPVLLISGTADPVGSYGRTVKKLHHELKKLGMKDVGLKLYEGARHELLNETNRQEVMQDVLKFLRAS